jgi:hypothetical protein
MPFGLNNATSAYRRLMDVIFKGEIGKSVVVYIDDIIVMSKTFDEHLAHLRETFSRLRDANLKLKLKKCSFAMNGIHCLGFVLNKDGYQPSPKNVAALKSLPIPNNIHDLQKFLGMAGYYRRMVKSYSNLTKPLTDLLQKRVKFLWNKEQQAAFEIIKRILTSYPVLAHFTPGLTTIIHTDASLTGIAGILVQIQNGSKLWKTTTSLTWYFFGTEQINRAKEKEHVSESHCWDLIKSKTAPNGDKLERACGGACPTELGVLVWTARPHGAQCRLKQGHHPEYPHPTPPEIPRQLSSGAHLHPDTTVCHPSPYCHHRL